MSGLVDGLLALAGGYNTALVLASTLLLGAAAGPVGVFILFRRRSLITDAIAHATLPGIALGFLLALALGLDGRPLPLLLAGAALTATLGVLAVQAIRDHTRLAEDAAIGAVLSVAFGAGIVLLSVIQNLPVGGQAGLDSFLLGQTAAMNAFEGWLIGIGAAVVLALVALGARAFATVCFDPAFAATLGWPVRAIDLAMVALALLVVVIGLKTVGLVLIIALLITPAVAARFWTERVGRMAWLAGAFGGAAGLIGSTLSARLPDLPTGGVIVLTAACFFLLSLFFAPRRGLLAGRLRDRRMAEAVRLRAAAADLHAGRPVTGADRRRLGRAGLADRAGGLTGQGRRQLAAWQEDERLWHRFILQHGTPPQGAYDVRPVEDCLLPDVIAALRRAGQAPP